MREETVSINGVLYNAKTGQPIKKVTPRKVVTPKPAPKKVFVRQPKKIVVKPAPKPAKRKPTPSQTLNRQFVKKPQVTRKQVAKKTPAKKATPQPKKPAPQRIQVVPPRIMSRGVKRPKPSTSPKSPMNNPFQTEPSPTTPNLSEKKKNRLFAIITGGAILAIIIGVVLAYFLLPSFSVWVASRRSGVNATLPVYTPSEYKVSGVAESSQGMVTINYHSNALNDGYSITEANSNWDSAGVLENKVKPLGGSYQTLNQKGLTIYRYSTGAIWVNGGILYTITDEGMLSNEQILHIVDGI